MDDRYPAAVAALRETMDEYDEDMHVVAASAAEIFVKELDKGDDSFLQGVDREQATKVLFVLTTALVLVRDQMIKNSEHLLEVQEEDITCEDDDCEYTHEEVDSDRVLAIIDGYEVAIAAAVGNTLTLADLAEDSDPDMFDHVIEMANSLGEDVNDGDEWPGWTTAEWLEDGTLFITYENPDNEVRTAKYRVTRIEG